MLYDEGKIKTEESVNKTQYPVQQCIFSISKELVYLQQRYFNILWDQAIPIAEKINEIEDLESQQLKALENPFEIQNMLTNLLGSTSRDVWLLFSSHTIFENTQRLYNLLEVLQSFQEKIGIKILVIDRNTTSIKKYERIQTKTTAKDGKTTLGKSNIEFRRIEK